MQPTTVRNAGLNQPEPAVQALTKPITSKSLPNVLITGILSYLPYRQLPSTSLINRQWYYVTVRAQIEILKGDIENIKYLNIYLPHKGVEYIIKQLEINEDVESLRKVILVADKRYNHVPPFIRLVQKGKLDLLIRAALFKKDDIRTNDFILEMILDVLFPIKDFQNAEKIVWMISPKKRNFDKLCERLALAEKFDEVLTLVNKIMDLPAKESAIIKLVSVYANTHRFDLAFKFAAMLTGISSKKAYKEIIDALVYEHRWEEALKLIKSLEDGHKYAMADMLENLRDSDAEMLKNLKESNNVEDTKSDLVFTLIKIMIKNEVLDESNWFTTNYLLEKLVIPRITNFDDVFVIAQYFHISRNIRGLQSIVLYLVYYVENIKGALKVINLSPKDQLYSDAITWLLKKTEEEKACYHKAIKLIQALEPNAQASAFELAVSKLKSQDHKKAVEVAKMIPDAQRRLKQLESLKKLMSKTK